MFLSNKFQTVDQRIPFALVFWAIAVTGGMLGLPSRLPLPSISVLVVASLLVLLLLYFCSSDIKRYISSLSPQGLIVFHLKW